MSSTPHLALPLLAAAQAQKHVTHNEALAVLDALVHLAVIERGRDAPPAAPDEGERYLVGAAPTGPLAGHAGEIAFFDLGLWRFLAPRPGWRAYVEAEDRIVVYDGSVWHDLGHYNRDLDNLQRLGIGTAADDANPLAAKLNAALFTARATGEGGTGDLRLVLNKAAAANVLSQLYQSNYSGRAEAGLIGGEDFAIRVSADGSLWRDALLVDRNTGLVSFPSGVGGGLAASGTNLLINGHFLVNQRGYAGGALAAGTYGFDRWKAGPGGCTLTRAADGTMTLAGAVEQVVEVTLAAGLADAPHLGGRTLTLSVEDPSAALAVTVGTRTGTIPAGAGRRSVTMTLGGAETGNITVRLQAASASFRRTKLEIGPLATAWSSDPPDIEEIRCRRYYQRIPVTASGPSTVGALGHRIGATIIEVPCVLPVAMRGPATLATSSIVWGAAPPSGPQIAFFDSAATGWTALTGSLSVTAYGTPGANAVTLRLVAGTSFSGTPGSPGTLYVGNGVTLALQAEL